MVVRACNCKGRKLASCSEGKPLSCSGVRLRICRPVSRLTSVRGAAPSKGFVGDVCATCVGRLVSAGVMTSGLGAAAGRWFVSLADLSSFSALLGSATAGVFVLALVT